MYPVVSNIQVWHKLHHAIHYIVTLFLWKAKNYLDITLYLEEIVNDKIRARWHLARSEQFSLSSGRKRMEFRNIILGTSYSENSKALLPGL